MDRKAERTAKFNRNKKSKHKQKNKKQKRNYVDDFEDSGVFRDTDRFRQRNKPQ